MKKIFILLLLITPILYGQTKERPKVRSSYLSFYDGTHRTIWSIGDSSGARLQWGKNPFTGAKDSSILMFKKTIIDSAKWNGDTSYVALADSGFISIGVKNIYFFDKGGLLSIADTIKKHRGELEVHAAQIKMNADTIQSKVSSTTYDAYVQQTDDDFNAVNNILAYHESQILQTSEQIDLRVLKTSFTGDTVISRINITPDSIKISASHIVISGATTFEAGYDPSQKVGAGGSADDINNNVTKINGGMISTNTLSAICANLGTVTAGDLSGVTIHTANDGFIVNSGGQVENLQTEAIDGKHLTLYGGNIGLQANGSPFVLTLSRDSNGGLNVNGDISSNGTKVSLDGHTHSYTTQTITYLDNNANPQTITVVTAVGGTN